LSYFGRVSYTQKNSTAVRVFIPPQVVKDFAGVRGRVQNAVAASPRSVSFSAAFQQVQAAQARPLKK
jgi:hypothetical protein